MANCTGTLSIHQGMGTAQNDRNPAALQPGFFLVDERTAQDLLLFVQRLSAHVDFYDQTNVADGNWSVFFNQESTSILIAIAGWNLELLQRNYAYRQNQIHIITDLEAQKESLSDYFTGIKSEFKKLSGTTEKLDAGIIQKENLVQSAHHISLIIDSVQAMIAQTDDVKALLQNYVFVKNVRQLFGLLLSWQEFSKGAIDFQLNSYPKHSPHYALFLSFLKLLDVARGQLNGYSKRHLDFYYRDVLRMQTQPAIPDCVHLVTEPFNVKPFLVPKGTVFQGGKNTAGKAKFYASTSDHVVNGITLKSILSNHSGDATRYWSDLSGFNGKGKSFDVFTSGQTAYQESVVVASPLLYLQSGQRTIKLRFNNTALAAADFEFYLTGEKKTIAITNKQDEEEFITLILSATEKKIIPFDPKLHPEFNVETAFPALKIVPVNPNVLPSLGQVELQVAVDEFKSFTIDSDSGIIDAAKPFYPFGEFPKNGNGIVISSDEFFMKKNAFARLDIVTLGEDGQDDLEWVNGKINLSQLSGGSWIYSGTDLDVINNNYPLTEYHFSETPAALSQGKLRIELAHDERYQGEKFMNDYLHQGKEETPALPYKPRFKSLSFHYNANESIEFDAPSNENPLEVYHATPFGYKKVTSGRLYFSPHNNLEGKVYIGFENAKPKDSLSFLVQLEEGTANPQKEPASIAWEFLDGNVWRAIESATMGDETAALTQSGLVRITLPEFVSHRTVFPDALFWLRISVSDTQALSRIMGIHVQAFKAVLCDYQQSGGIFTESAPKETINKAERTILGIKKIIQPYASFAGRPAEKDEVLYRRTSERLRHKNRAITSWDYEHIILEEFPEVFRVKTLNHYRYERTISNVAAGYITLIPIAQSSASQQVSWKPLLSIGKMRRISEHVAQIASPHARIQVKPPRPELVTLVFKVKFREFPGTDTGLYTQRLIELINRHLSPWAYDAPEIEFAKEIEFSSLIRLIDNEPYVDYLTDFNVMQYLLNADNEIEGSPIENLNSITPQTDFTLFIPSEQHRIEVL